MKPLHIIMPVKDSIETCTLALQHLVPTLSCPEQLTLYNDFSTDENTQRLKELAEQYGFNLLNWAEHTQHPSPNYLLTL